MDPQRFAHIKEILLSARSRPPSERSAWLDEACGTDLELRQEVESLLAQDESSASILETGRIAAGWKEPLAAPAQIGPYRLVEVLGEGGMGVVYRAQQTHPIEREVALKLTKRSTDSAQVAARFEHERQTLASMEHPNVARVLDAGADEQGRPYFVMELVRGEAITHFADRMRLSVPERLALVLDVCRAVQHAHQRGVIHRDLKPSNILVAPTDDGVVVKVIDFGIAKALESTNDAPTMTQEGQLVGTPQYMSPEQAGVVSAGVDTRTDVYSLGVLLYELLTGHRPLRFDTQADFFRVLGESEPLRASVAARQGDEPETIAAARSASVARLSRQLAGDLENIMAMAMRKEPDRRYSSVDQLAEDLVRWQDGLPVRARTDTFWYRTGKFVRRHRTRVVVGALLVLGILGFVVTNTVQSARVSRERDRAVVAEEQATQQAETAERALRFMVELFEVSDPSEAKGNTVLARDVLDRGAVRIREELADEPAVRATLMDAIGRVYQSLGLWDESEPLLEEALEIRRELLGEQHLDTAESKANLAFLYWDQARLLEAEPLIRQGLAARAAQLEPTDERVSSSRFALASLLHRMGDLDGAEEEFRNVLELERATLGPQHPYVAMDLNNLASVHLAKDELDEAERLYRESLEINLAAGGPDHPETATNYDNLASVLMRRGDNAEALRHAEKAMQIRTKIYGAEHPHIAMSLGKVAVHLEVVGRFPEAEQRFVEAIAMNRRIHGEAHPNLAHNLMGLGRLLSQQDRHRDAIDRLQQAVEVARAVLPEGHNGIARPLYELGAAYLRDQQPVRAEAPLQEALEVRRARLPPQHRETLMSVGKLGACYAQQQRWKEAEPLVREAHDGWRDRFGEAHERTKRAKQALEELPTP